MSNMVFSRKPFQPEEPEELLRFLSNKTKENRDHKALRECLPTLQVQSLADMRIHEQMGGSPVRSWRNSYTKDSDTDSNYDQAETSPFDHHYDGGSLNTSPISNQYIPDQLRTKVLSFNSESSNSLTSPRFRHRISNLGERISINEMQPARPSPHTSFYAKPNAFPNYLGPHPDLEIDHDKVNPFEDYPSDDSEISALKFRIVELEYVNAALEGKLRQYRDEIRLFKKDVRGYKNDGRRFTQQLKDKNMEITALHTKIIQLLNNDTLVSPQRVTSNSSGFSTKLSTANSHATAKQRKGSKAVSEDLRNRSRMTGHRDDAHLKNQSMSWV